MLRQMKLSFKIWLGVAILILGYCLSMSLSYYSSRMTQTELRSMAEFAGDSSEFSQQAIVSFNSQLKNYENAVLMGETDFITDGNAASKTVQKNLNSLAELSGLSSTTRQSIEEQLSTHASFTENGESVYTKYCNGDTDASITSAIKTLAKQQELLKTALSELSMMVRDDLLLNINGAVDESINQNRINLGLFVCVVAASVLIVYFLVKFSILAPLYTVLEGLDDSSREVSKVSDQLAASSSQLSEGASQQAASIEEASSSLEEMSSMTRQNADSASQADNLMQETSHVVENANNSMAELTAAMEGISRSSEETSKIIKTIDDIAFQTNLLALNAAVEAARAGDAGAGFAVVADEVRNLAMRAADAAKNTSTLIEDTSKKIKEGEGLVGTTSNAFSQVAESAGKVAGLLGEIALASNEQAGGIDHVSKAVTDIDQIVQENSASAEENTSTSEEMSAMALQMNYFVAELLKLVEGGNSRSNNHRGGYQPVKESRSAGALRAAEPVPALTEAGARDRREVAADQVIPMNNGDDYDFEDF